MKIRSNHVINAGILLALLVVFMFLGTIALADRSVDKATISTYQLPPGGWKVEIVDDGVSIGVNTSLKLDGAGLPHVSYSDGQTLKYARYDGADWQIETVASFESMDVKSSLALDESDHPHIAYYHAESGHLMHAWYDGATWHTETIDEQATEERQAARKVNQGMYYWPHVSLVAGEAGQLYVSYRGYFTVAAHGLKYARYDGTSWHIEVVDGWHSGYYNSLALDQAGRPHISYYHAIDIYQDLRYAWHDGTTWRIEIVDNDGDVGKSSSLALDEADHPHISYYDATNNAVKYAWHDGVSWHTETVDDNPLGADAGHHSGLALDSAGHAHISYGPNYAQHDGTSWHIESPAPIGGEFSSLVMDDLDLPCISYHNYQNALEYAHWVPPAPLSLQKTADPYTGLLNNGILTYTLTLSGSGLGIRLWDPLPPGVQYVSNSVTLPATYDPAARAIVWEGRLPTDTVQVIRFQVTPDINGTGSLSLAPPIVNTAWLTNTEYDRTLSATVIVNGQYVYLPLVTRILGEY